MIEILLAIIAAELGFALLIGVGIFGFEFYSLWLRYKTMKEEAGLTRIRLSPEEMEKLLSGGGLPDKLSGAVKPVADPTAAPVHGMYH